jgi:hypothetical protein
MANQIERRLMAAGASPQRAKQFAVQFQKAQQAKSPSRNLKPKDISDAFAAELEAASRQQFPEAFRPPTSIDPGFLDYAEFVLTPQRFEQLKNRSYLDYAPNFKASLDIGTNTVKGRLAQNIANGYTPDEAIEFARQELALDPTALDDFMDATNPLNTEKNAKKFLDDIYKEKNAFELGIAKDTENTLKLDKEYKAGIPAKGLKYGAGTNLKKGIVDIATRPGVKDFYKKADETFKQKFPGASQAGGIAVETVLKKANQQGLNPRDDEFQRRYDIKFRK